MIHPAGISIFRKLKPEGRYGWAGCVKVAPDQNMAMEQTNQWMAVDDLSSYIVTEAKYNPNGECNQGKGLITIIKENILQQIIRVENTQSGWIIQKDVMVPRMDCRSRRTWSKNNTGQSVSACNPFGTGQALSDNKVSTKIVYYWSVN